jgi:hypothetical protein
LEVFDADSPVGLVQFDKSELHAPPLMFRVLHSLRPFFVARCVLGARQLWLNPSRNSGPPA